MKTPWRLSLYILTFIALGGFQLFQFHTKKGQNFFEVLNLESSKVDTDLIHTAFKGLNKKYNPKTATDPESLLKFEKIKEAFTCLKVPNCRNQYTRFGDSIVLTEGRDFDFDWRVGFSVCFYIVFAFANAALASVEQKPGIRMSLALGIVFCMTEVQLLQDTQAQIMDGQKSDPKIETLLSYFPPTYCVFEVITSMRIVYFICFNVICSFSLIFIVDDAKQKVEYGKRVVANQKKLTELSQKVYTAMTERDLNLSREFLKKDYRDVAKKAHLDVSEGAVQIDTGKTADQIKTSTNWKKTLTRIASGLCFAVFLGSKYWPQISPYFNQLVDQYMPKSEQGEADF